MPQHIRRRVRRIGFGSLAALSLLLLFTGGALEGEMGRPLPGQGGAGGGRVPPVDLNDAAMVQAGAALFARTCGVGYCHGSEGREGGGPRLRGRKLDAEYLFDTITNGKRLMPTWGHLYSPEQIWQLVAYIKSLENVKDDP